MAYLFIETGTGSVELCFIITTFRLSAIWSGDGLWYTSRGARMLVKRSGVWGIGGVLDARPICEDTFEVGLRRDMLSSKSLLSSVLRLL